MMTLVAPVEVSPDVKAELIKVSSAMLQEGLPVRFVTAALETAFRYEGVGDLMKLWQEERDEGERDEIVADIQELVDDCAKKNFTEGTYIRFDDLDAIAKDIRAFKDSLRVIVDERGGIGRLAELTGIPQPSLSRLFSSPSMPRRVTLLKIARALDLSEVQIATPWTHN